ncbi:hypothetical protein M8C21_012066 [Ambrosia artemisiifolia]|uniref:Reverse transcriptase zinc-binding domain-containing protein n=1 Tax=Ambrosia artemisiifolia TaxID=4212 RepID=A0AAD5CTE4_AMBAR|nr:hypothetical protein M8C21_012066 [Ambrosia artemisiifolia]
MKQTLRSLDKNHLKLNGRSETRVASQLHLSQHALTSYGSLHKACSNSEAIHNFRCRIKWVNWVPLKCNVMAWRASMGHLPVKTELLKRNVQVDNQVASMGGDLLYRGILTISLTTR